MGRNTEISGFLKGLQPGEALQFSFGDLRVIRREQPEGPPTEWDIPENVGPIHGDLVTHLKGLAEILNVGLSLAGLALEFDGFYSDEGEKQEMPAVSKEGETIDWWKITLQYIEETGEGYLRYVVVATAEA